MCMLLLFIKQNAEIPSSNPRRVHNDTKIEDIKNKLYQHWLDFGSLVESVVRCMLPLTLGTYEENINCKKILIFR